MLSCLPKNIYYQGPLDIHQWSKKASFIQLVRPDVGEVSPSGRAGQLALGSVGRIRESDCGGQEGRQGPPG